MKDVIIRLFGKKRVPKILQYDFLLPDIVILQIIAGSYAREARVGQSPILIDYGQPLFVWLSRD